ncbi:MAG: DUF7146 domain-containing protein, partial [Planctomycetota bacterium]
MVRLEQFKDPAELFAHDPTDFPRAMRAALDAALPLAEVAPLPVIDAGSGDIVAMAERAWRALIRSNDPPRLFRHPTGIVRVEEDAEGGWAIQTLGEPHLRHELARAASWVKPSKDGPLVSSYPPQVVVQDMLARGAAPIPYLERLVESPVFARDGRLHAVPGYDSSSRCLYVADGLEVPSVPKAPTDEEVETARERLLEPFRDFPFVGQAERAHALVLVLQPLIRDLILGPTPLHAIEAPGPGTGKTLLVTVAFYIFAGREPHAMTEGRNEDEWRKRLTAVLRNGPPAIVIDNVQRRLMSSALAAAITSTKWEDRLLGQSETLRLPIRSTWITTSNNPSS